MFNYKVHKAWDKNNAIVKEMIDKYREMYPDGPGKDAMNAEDARTPYTLWGIECASL